MNETNTQQPELLAAILAEMRDFCSGRPEDLDVTVKVGLIYGWACRLKAAAERERAITDIMLAVKDKPLPHPDQDNAPPLFFPMTKTQLQTLSDLVAIAHDEMDGLPRHEQELERFDSLLFDMKARYAFDKPYAAPGNAAAMREALEWAAQFVELGVDDDRGADGQNLTTAAEMARAALAAPARNADRFATAEDMRVAFMRDARNTEGLDHLVCLTEIVGRVCKWLFAPAKGGEE